MMMWVEFFLVKGKGDWDRDRGMGIGMGDRDGGSREGGWGRGMGRHDQQGGKKKEGSKPQIFNEHTVCKDMGTALEK